MSQARQARALRKVHGDECPRRRDGYRRGAAAEAVSAVLSGSGARAALEPLGQAALAAVLAYYDAPAWPPNAASTVAQKGRSDPLVETGELRGAIGYELRGKNF